MFYAAVKMCMANNSWYTIDVRWLDILLNFVLDNYFTATFVHKKSKCRYDTNTQKYNNKDY